MASTTAGVNGRPQGDEEGGGGSTDANGGGMHASGGRTPPRINTSLQDEGGEHQPLAAAYGTFIGGRCALAARMTCRSTSSTHMPAEDM